MLISRYNNNSNNYKTDDNHGDDEDNDYVDDYYDRGGEMMEEVDVGDELKSNNSNFSSSLSSLDSDECRYLTESGAREAFSDYVASQCCFSSKPLTGLNIKSLKTRSVYKVSSSSPISF